LAVLTMFLAPLAVRFDLTPFQGIQGGFWLFGFAAAHVTIFHGALATIRHKGFNRVSALVMGAGVLIAAAYMMPGSMDVFGLALPKVTTMALAGMGGVLVGGFITGITFFFSLFFRDKIFFASRLAVKTAGQIEGHRGISFEFKISGSAGD